MSAKFSVSLAIFIFLTLKTAAFPLPEKPQDTIHNHSILFYHGNSEGIACTYCTDEFYSEKTYYKKECYDQYLKIENNITHVDNGEIIVYHPLCQPFPDAVKYKEDVRCPISHDIENGITPLQNYYDTFKDRPPAYITEPIVGSRLKIICDRGYITDNSFSECSVINQKPMWNPTPRCRRIGCFGMPDPENGISNCNENIVDNGTICNITCNQGYTPNEDYTLCLEGEFTMEISCQQISMKLIGTSTLIDWIFGIIGGIIIIAILVFLCRRYELWKKFGKQVRPQQNGHVLQQDENAGQGNQHGQVNGNGHVAYNGLYVTLPDNGTRIPSNPDSPADISITLSSIQDPPSNISPESRPSSIVSVPTETTILTPVTPSDVLSPDVPSPDVQSSDEDGEHTPLMADENRPSFIPDNNSAVQPMEASFESGSSDVGSNTMHHSSNPLRKSEAGNMSADIATETRTPVENEDIQDEEVKSEKKHKQPMEHEDDSNFPTLNSTGSDLLDMVRGCDATNPKEFLEDDETNPKAFREVPEIDPERAEPSAETLRSNPSLLDFGITRTDSEKKDEAMKELGQPTNRSYDAAYGSSEVTLDSNPKPLIMCEEVPIVKKEEEDDQEVLREFPNTDTDRVEPSAETLDSNPSLVDYGLTGTDNGVDTGRGTMGSLDGSMENIDDFALIASKAKK